MRKFKALFNLKIQKIIDDFDDLIEFNYKNSGIKEIKYQKGYEHACEDIKSVLRSYLI